nr:unnamed protein product [Callosobruchus analis]
MEVVLKGSVGEGLGWRLYREKVPELSTRDSSDDDDDDGDRKENLIGSSEISSDPSSESVIEEVEYICPEQNLLTAGTFILVRFLSGKRKAIEYINTKFKLVENDISTIPISDIIAILPDRIKNSEVKEIYFKKKVDIKELK